MIRIVFTVFAFIAGTTGTQAQMQPAPGQRMFDIVSGIVFTCASATGFAWTGEACDKLAAEFRKRAEAARLPFVEVPITADFVTKRMVKAGEFDQDKAVRVFWNFTAADKGLVRGALSSYRIWEPTDKEVPNAVPGQRIPQTFWAQSAVFERGTTYGKAAEYLAIITNSFFIIGEKRS